MVSVRRVAAEQIAASRAAVKGVEDNIGGAWYGPLPMLRLIMALVDSDEMRRAYMCRNNIANARIVMDNQKSTEKRATTVEEQMSTVESKIQQLKSDMNDLNATPQQKNRRNSPSVSFVHCGYRWVYFIMRLREFKVGL